MGRHIMNNQHLSRSQRIAPPSRQRLLDRYHEHLRLAEAKISTGDRIGAENDYQHAEHFFRSAAEAQDAYRQ